MDQKLTILDNIRFASPCEADWAEMAGDDRSRFCSICSKKVYNLSAMTADAATALIADREGRTCVRLYRRADGTTLTADCPVGSRSAPRRGVHRSLWVVLGALLVASAASAGLGHREIAPFPMGPGITWNDRVDWALTVLGRRPPPPPTTPPSGGMVLMGDVY